MISRLALGTVQFGMPYGISNTRGQVPLDEVCRILHEAHNAGIDTIDTAYAYGDSEATLGKAISETQAFKIVTKFPAADQGKSPRHLWQESCARLGNRSIYAYLLHNYHSFQERLHLVDFLQELKNRGEVEKTGFSLYHPKELEEILTRNMPFEILQVPYSILDQRFACYFPELHQRGIEIHTRSSFLQGLVFRDPTSLPAFFSPARPSLQRISKEAETLGVSVADFCLTFCLMNNNIDRVVIGVESIENLRDNIRCAQNVNRYSSHPSFKEDFALNQPQILKIQPSGNSHAHHRPDPSRMGSTRLPGKVLMNILGLPVLQHVVQRVQKSQQVDEAIVITSTHIQDQPIVDWCTNHGVRVFCGSEDDVLDRFYQTSKLIRANALVRITADCPLMDPLVIDQVVNLFKTQNVDYANNCENETWPDGLDVEVFKPEALEKAWKQTQVKSDREHVTPYIRRNTLLFSQAILDYSPSLKGMRWTLDQPEDFTFISKIYHELYIKNPFFGMKDVLTLLEEQPSLSTLNNGIIRNEGYLKSLSQDIPHE